MPSGSSYLVSQCISVIASGIGEPLHTEKSRLDPINIGTTKVKVVIKLDSTLPSTVVVRDVQGNSARVDVDYPRPPPKCLNCGKYGHLLSRCPQPLMKKLPFKKDTPAGSKEVVHPSLSLHDSGAADSGCSQEKLTVSDAAFSKLRRRRSRSKKRSLSSPPRIVDPLSSANAEDSSLKKPVDRKLRVVKPVGAVVAPSTNSIPRIVNEPVLVQSTGNSVKSKRDSITSPDPDFPIPPGWAVMSTKAKKKELKKWHNRIRSALSGAHGIVRGESSSGSLPH
ncbi:unnamed protein product [Arabidopsis lyrata]|uniref:CCHC-type domain-containing protein n=1 Tax=Arabidopsis lyrata subsp. lyrata TaxID=81972 RepID=D7LUK2_ARALL|nr:hypothetical protein ARALYDRAFT_348453 [Arabidopsis lyrata subsp. lyrata]CAH8268506.1 unnamed protein product [Arabidopsis lyrata]